MTRQIQSELNQLREDFLQVYALVATDLRQAVQAAVTADRELVQEVRQTEALVNESEVAVEAECLRLIALHAPVADDLRFVIGVLLVNRDLERIGDLAAAVAGKAENLSQPAAGFGPDLNALADRVLDMLQRAVDSFIQGDQMLAKSVVADRAEAHLRQRETSSLLRGQILERAADAGYLLDVLSITKYLERAADHAANIAEEVLYMLGGEIVRHRTPAAAPRAVPAT